MLPFDAPRRRPSGQNNGRPQIACERLDLPTDSAHGRRQPLASSTASAVLLCLPLFYRCSFRTGLSE